MKGLCINSVQINGFQTWHEMYITGRLYQVNTCNTSSSFSQLLYGEPTVYVRVSGINDMFPVPQASCAWWVEGFLPSSSEKVTIFSQSNSLLFWSFFPRKEPSRASPAVVSASLFLADTVGLHIVTVAPYCWLWMSREHSPHVEMYCMLNTFTSLGRSVHCDCSALYYYENVLSCYGKANYLF